MSTIAPLFAQPRRPNVLLILADDLGYEGLSCYGSTSYKTPRLDRLAAEGVRFTHAYAQPLCTPTRVQLMTGLSNHRNWRAFGVMDPKEKTFGHYMHDAGYKTVIAGKWQLYSYNPPDFEPEWRGKGKRPEDAGFDDYCLWHFGHTEEKGSRYGDPTYLVNGKLHKVEKDRYGDDIFSDHIVNFVSRHKSEPWFAYYPMALTHAPYNPTPKSKTWTQARLKNDPANFKDMVEYMDDVIGRLLDRLDQMGQLENTLVLYYSDNGTGQEISSRMADGRVIRGGKGLTIDTGIHVPMIAYWKGKTKAGLVTDTLVDSTDFLPTIFEAIGARLPVKVDGRSFLPQMLGQKGHPREWVYFWYNPLPGHGKEQFHKTIFALDHEYKLYSDGRFYRVSTDPDEKTPLDQSKAPAVYRKLKAAMGAMGGT